jgi:antitoxin component HigA of HigAB toxin-antitoxin module
MNDNQEKMTDREMAVLAIQFLLYNLIILSEEIKKADLSDEAKEILNKRAEKTVKDIDKLRKEYNIPVFEQK